MARIGLLGAALPLLLLGCDNATTLPRVFGDGGSADAALAQDGATSMSACEQATEKLLDWCEIDTAGLQPGESDAGVEDAGPPAAQQCAGPVECIARCTLEAPCDEILQPSADSAYLACTADCTE